MNLPRTIGCVACLITILLSGCGQPGNGQAQLTPSSARNPDGAAINARLQKLPPWPEVIQEVLTPSSLDPVLLSESSGFDFRCEVEGREHVKGFEEINSAGSNEDVLWPGSLIQGASLETGRLESLPVPRAPITIRIDLAVENQAITIAEPNSVTAGQAIADLQRAGLAAVGEVDPIRSNMIFDLAEASTFEQSMLSMGVSGGFTDPYSGVGAEGNIQGSVERSRRTHSIIVKFIQEMFTISLADDLPALQTPADFFSETVSLDDLQQLEAMGRLGPDNLPVYIKSVTYGRVLMFTMTSTDVESAATLSAAMNASFMDYVEGGGNLSAEHRTALENSTAKAVVFGGPQDAATAALGALDWSLFFTPAPATTAVPISFTVKTLHDRRIAAITDNINYEVRGNCQEPTGYQLRVTLKSITRTSGDCCLEGLLGNCTTTCQIDSSFATDDNCPPNELIVPLTVLHTGFETFQSGSTRTLNQTRTVDTRSGDKLYLQYSGAGAGLAIDHQCFEYPFAELTNGTEVPFGYNLNAVLRSFRFDYGITKTAQFPPLPEDNEPPKTGGPKPVPDE